MSTQKKYWLPLFVLLFLLVNVMWFMHNRNLQQTLNSLPEAELLQKLRNKKVIIVKDPLITSDSFSNYEELMTQMQIELQPYVDIVESQTSNSAEDLLRKHNDANMKMSFSITIEKYNDPQLGPLHNVNIRAKVTRLSTGNISMFRRSLSGVNRGKTIAELCKIIANEIKERLVSNEKFAPEGRYILKFVKLQSNASYSQLRKSILALKEQGKIKYEESEGHGKLAQNYIVDWERAETSKTEVISVIIEACAKQGLLMESNKSANEVIYFQPPGSDWDDIPNTKRDTLEKSIFRPSELDIYLQVEDEFVFKENSLLRIPFELRQDAPKNWYFHAIYFSNSQGVYLLCPNRYEQIKLMAPEKKYIFADKDLDLVDWGIGWKLTLPANFDEDRDQLLLFITEKPVDILLKKAKQGKEGYPVVLSWDNLEQVRKSVGRYIHRVVNIVIQEK